MVHPIGLRPWEGCLLLAIEISYKLTKRATTNNPLQMAVCYEHRIRCDDITKWYMP